MAIHKSLDIGRVRHKLGYVALDNYKGGCLLNSKLRSMDLGNLITHEFKLEEADKAFDLGAHPTDDVVKIVVKMK